MLRIIRRVTRVMCIVVLALVFLSGEIAITGFNSFPNLTEEAYALASAGIMNNGLGGISIDINAFPYSGAWTNGAPYGTGGCTWFVGARVRELTGKGALTTQVGSTWYNSYGASLGFSRGQDIQEGAILCWSGHVAFVEKIEGSTVYMSEGGSTYYSDAAHGYCIIRAININSVKGLNGGFIGCVYTGATDTHTPKGWVDECNLNSNGTIHVRGWAFDKDALGQYCDIHVYVGDEGHALGKADQYRPDVNNVHGCGNYHGYEFNFSTAKTGTQTVYIHACNIGGTPGNNRMIESRVLNIPADTVKPTVTNVTASNYTSTGFTVTYDVSDNRGVTRASVAVWNSADPDSSQACWFPATISNGKATANIKYASITGGTTATHFNVHAYAWDAANNAGMWYITEGATKDNTPPSISNVSVENLSVTGYDIKFKASDAGGVSKAEVYSYWYNDEDQNYETTQTAVLSGGYYTVHVDAHKAGSYRNIIYVWDKYNNKATYSASPSRDVTVPTDSEAPILENVTWSFNNNIFTLEFDAYDQGEGELSGGTIRFFDGNVNVYKQLGALLYHSFNFMSDGSVTTSGSDNWEFYCKKNERNGNHFHIELQYPDAWDVRDDDPGFAGWHGFSIGVGDYQKNSAGMDERRAFYIEPAEKVYHKVGKQATYSFSNSANRVRMDGVVVTEATLSDTENGSPVTFTPSTIGPGYVRPYAGQTRQYSSLLFTAYDDLSNCDITLSDDVWYYDDADAEIPEVTVKYGDQLMEEGVNYNVEYIYDDIDGESGEIPEQGEIIITGIKDGYLEGTVRKTFAIESKNGCDHSNTVTVITKATTANDGSIVTKCSKDGTVLMEETIPKIDKGTVFNYCNNTYSVVLTDSTGEVIDENQYDTLKSGNIIRVTFNSAYYDGMLSLDIPSEKIHEWSDEYTIDQEATTEADGSMSIHCRNCNEIQAGSEVVIPKINDDDPHGDNTKILSSIVILGEPDKTEYVAGETFDPSGLLVGKRYVNDEIDEAAASEYRLSSPNMNKIGEQTVYVTLSGKVAYFSITIRDKTAVSMEVTEPTKTVYHQGDKFDSSGMKVVVTYDNGKKAEVTDYKISGFSNEPGTQLIKISYGNLDDYVFFIEMHEIGEWITTKEATYDSDGLKERTCSICGEKQTEVIPKLHKDTETEEPAVTPAAPSVRKGKTYKYGSQKYTVTKLPSGSKPGEVAFTAAKNVGKVTVPASVKLADGKTYNVTTIRANAFTGKSIRTVTISKNVKKINKNAFKASKATKIILKTKKLTKKASVKGSLKGSKVTTIQVKVGKKAVNTKYVKKYKKVFTKKNAGKKVTVKK